jgi:hypothetical protein
VSLLSGPGSKFTKKWEVTFKKSTSKIVVFLMLGSVKLGREIDRQIQSKYII